jgi:hypothetical protein
MRREMTWFRYMCEGRRTGGSHCERSVLVCDITGELADRRVQDEFGWKPIEKRPCSCDCHGRKGDQGEHCQSCTVCHTETGEFSWLCDLKHREESDAQA